MGTEGLRRKLAAILSADVKGYSRLMGEDEEWTVRALNAHKGVIRNLVGQHRGRVVDSPGDNLLAEFGSVVDAVQCAVEIQQVLKAKNALLPQTRRMEFRIGINLGDVIEEEDRIYGDGVNIAARLEGLAEPGGICISESAFQQIENKVPLQYVFMGEHDVKNIARPVRAYRALLEAEAEGKAKDGARREAQGARCKERSAKRKAYGIGLAAVLVLIVAGAVWQFVLAPEKVEKADPNKMAYPLPDKPSIAVLPFANLSGDPQQEFFSDGLTEDLITALSKVPRLFVIARNSSSTYKGKPVKVQRVAEELGVRYVLEGSVQKSGDRVRITVQLIDALKGNHVWSDRYDREMKEFFALQDTIALETLMAIDVKLTYGEGGRVHGKGTDNLEAYLKFLQARELTLQWNRESNVQARQLVEEALRLDSQYPSAYNQLAVVNMMDVWLGISKSPKDSMNKAIELAQKAVTLDDSHHSAHALLGFLYVQIREHEKGVASCERAIEMAPHSADVHSWFAQVLNYSGRPQEAIAYNEKAFRLNPVGPPNFYYGHAAVTYMLTGRYEAGVKMCKELLARSPNNVPGHAILVQTYAEWGRDEEARAAAQELLRVDPRFSAVRRAKSLPFKDLALQTHYLELMRKAGLPD